MLPDKLLWLHSQQGSNINVSCQEKLEHLHGYELVMSCLLQSFSCKGTLFLLIFIFIFLIKKSKQIETSSCTTIPFAYNVLQCVFNKMIVLIWFDCEVNEKNRLELPYCSYYELLCTCNMSTCGEGICFIHILYVTVYECYIYWNGWVVEWHLPHSRTVLILSFHVLSKLGCSWPVATATLTDIYNGREQTFFCGQWSTTWRLILKFLFLYWGHEQTQPFFSMSSEELLLAHFFTGPHLIVSALKMLSVWWLFSL